MAEKKVYVVPQVTSYTEQDILAELGDARFFRPPPPSLDFFPFFPDSSDPSGSSDYVP